MWKCCGSWLKDPERRTWQSLTPPVKCRVISTSKVDEPNLAIIAVVSNYLGLELTSILYTFTVERQHWGTVEGLRAVDKDVLLDLNASLALNAGLLDRDVNRSIERTRNCSCYKSVFWTCHRHAHADGCRVGRASSVSAKNVVGVIRMGRVILSKS